MANGFDGFPKETFQFLSDLSNNNNKGWFDANRDHYEKYFKTPAFALTSALTGQMAALPLPLKAEARINGTLRRINRDVRFSKDKSPYNARMHLIFWSGSHPNRSAAFHLVLSTDGLGLGAGVFGLDPPRLTRLRDRIVQPKDRATLLAAIGKAENTGCEFDTPDLKRLPAGYQTDQDWEHLLRRKAFVMRTLQALPAPDWIFTADAVPRILKIATALSPFNSWLSKP